MLLSHILEVEKILFGNDSDWMTTHASTHHEINIVNLPASEMAKVYDALDFCSENKSYQAVEIINHTLEDLFRLEEGMTPGLFLIYHPNDSNKTYSQISQFATKKLTGEIPGSVVSIFESSDIYKRVEDWGMKLDQKKTLLANESDYLDYSIIFMNSLFNKRSSQSPKYTPHQTHDRNQFSQDMLTS